VSSFCRRRLLNGISYVVWPVLIYNDRTQLLNTKLQNEGRDWKENREDSWLRSLLEQDKSGSAWIGSAGEFLCSGLTDLFKKQVIIIRKNF